jgi:hypothetical protein
MIHPRYGDLNVISQKTDGNCHICHQPAPLEYYGSPAVFGGQATTIDHLLCQSHGGTDHPSNLRLAHASCNSSRGTRPVREARLELAGTTSHPWSTNEKNVATTVVVASSFFVGGHVFARTDNRYQKSFNWEAALLTALGVGLVACALR